MICLTCHTASLPGLLFPPPRLDAPAEAQMSMLCPVSPQPGSLDGKPPAPLLAAEHLSLRVNPNGMLPMILASVVVHALPGGLSVLLGPGANAAVAAFQRSAAQPIVFCVAVFFADFTSLTQQTPKRLAQYLQAVRKPDTSSRTESRTIWVCVHVCS